MPAAGRPHTDKTRERISKGVRRALVVRAEQERLVPRLAAFRRQRGLDSLHRSLLALAANEVAAIVEAQGGIAEMSPQKLRLVEDAAIAGVIMNREFAEYVKSRDSEAAARVATLINSRRATFSLIGLDVRRADPLDISSYAAASKEVTP